MGEEFTFEDVMIIIRRRLKIFLIPALILAPLLSIGVMLLPAKYTSEGIMLIQSPQISTELVKKTGSATALERIEVNRQRIIARSNLLDIAEKADLFSDWGNYSETKKVKKMKKRFKVTPISSEFTTGNTQSDAFAFRVAYTDPSKEKAMAVANEFINRLETQDRQQTVKDASDTTEFFEKETERLTAELRVIQQEIAEFKRENNGSLPGQLALHERQLERFTTRLTNIETQISSVNEDKRLVESQMASNASGGGNENSPESRLLSLKAKLAEERAKYTDQHPEIKALKAEINALERQLSPGRELQNLQRQVEQAEDAVLAAEKAKAPEDEIAALTAEANRLSDRFIRRATSSQGLSSSAQNFLLQSSLISLQKRARSLEERRKNLVIRYEDLEDRITKTPAVESVLKDRERELKLKEDALERNRIRQDTAQQSENLQAEDRAERIMQIEPAVLPEKPSSPNRPALIFLAVIFSAMVGALLAIGYEFLNATIRGRGHLTNILEEPPLATIPYIQGDETRGFRFPGFGLGRGNRDNSGDVGSDDIGSVPAE